MKTEDKSKGFTVDTPVVFLVTENNKYGIGLIGYPAAGKSYSVNTLEESPLPCEGIAIGDIVRDILSDHPEYGPEPTGSEIREWVTAKLDEDDEAVIREVVTELDTRSFNGYPVIDGIRTPADVRVLNDYFDEFVLIFLDAPDEVRLERIQERGRDEEEQEFTMEDLKERDADEEAWGLGEIIDDAKHDITLDSAHDRYSHQLTKTTRRVIDNWE